MIEISHSPLHTFRTMVSARRILSYSSQYSTIPSFRLYIPFEQWCSLAESFLLQAIIPPLPTKLPNKTHESFHFKNPTTTTFEKTSIARNKISSKPPSSTFTGPSQYNKSQQQQHFGFPYTTKFGKVSIARNISQASLSTSPHYLRRLRDPRLQRPSELVSACQFPPSCISPVVFYSFYFILC
jgi:hypothetical protein